jgi:hypothetical protein
MTPAVVLIALVCAVIGTIIGIGKGHPVWGFCLGLLLPVIGLVVIAVTKPSAEYQARKATERMRAAEREARRRLGGQ